MSTTNELGPKLRWGIMGTARIATKNARAMALSPSAELVAVASRDIERCKTWVHENACKPFDTVTCHGTYDALLDNPHVDAVYIPLPTTMHAEWVAKAAAKGKHVLVEKPVGVNLAEVTSMVDACMKHRRLFMDGVMFMHHKRLHKVEEQLRGDPAGFFGPVTRVNAAFSFAADQEFLAGGDIRTQASGDPLGCLGDLGVYCIRIGQAAFGWDVGPSTCRAVRVRRNQHGVPIDVTAEVYWKNNNATAAAAAAAGADRASSFVPEPTLAFHCSFLHPLRQNVEMMGSGRTITMDDFVVSDPDDSAFVLTRSLDPIDKATVFLRDVRRFGSNGTSFVQEAAMFDTFAAAAHELASAGVGGDCGGGNGGAAAETISTTNNNHSGGGGVRRPFSPHFWPAVAMQTQAILDAVLASDAQKGAEVAVPVVPSLLFA